VALDGDAEMEKSGGFGAGVTIRRAFAVWVSEPLVAVKRREYFPAGVDADVVIVASDVPAPLNESGVNEMLAFGGSPVTEKLRVPAKPPNAVAARL